MYQYNQIDQTIVDQRVDQFREQTDRFLKGQLSEDEFRPLRLMNGLYIQRHAPMLRIAVPYGLMSSRQLHTLADICQHYDRGYGHFTTRQNLQLNWPTLESVPDILAELAAVQMHAIQTSGNCIRNTTSDPLAGVIGDELEDPRPYCELIRQWSTLHPEFSYLPRKFKIAVSGSQQDRASTKVHDIGVQIVQNTKGELGFQVLVGGGLGRTPVVGKVIRDFLPKTELLRYLEAILRIYNLYGRRDNKYKARIKILVNSLGIDAFSTLVEEEYLAVQKEMPALSNREITSVQAHFIPPDYSSDQNLEVPHSSDNLDFHRWYKNNTKKHKVAGYRIVYASLKHADRAQGDITSEQMHCLADLAEQYSFGEIRSTYTQNLVLADVAEKDLLAVWHTLDKLHLARPNIGRATDMITCPGLDFCSLANASTIGVAAEIDRRIDPLDFSHDLGEIRINFSGCMNACGHHHTGHIGILGVDKKGEEWYQLTLGGSGNEQAALGKVIGRAVSQQDLPDVIYKILDQYVSVRSDETESFLDAVNRLGLTPFKEAAYATVD